MSDVDTRKAGSGRTVSYATIRFESGGLLPEQLVELLAEAARHADVKLQVVDQGTGAAVC